MKEFSNNNKLLLNFISNSYKNYKKQAIFKYYFIIKKLKKTYFNLLKIIKIIK